MSSTVSTLRYLGEGLSGSHVGGSPAARHATAAVASWRVGILAKAFITRG